jgi:hypothetical protein
MVFIPSSDTPDKRVKGHNRVVEAINAGRVAITYPLPQYRELSAYSFCDADYGASIRAALSDPAGALKKIADGQHYIDTRFACDAVAEKMAATDWRSSTADLKFLHHLQQTLLGTSNRKTALESWSCWCPFVSEVRVRTCRGVSRTSETGHQPLREQP